MAHPNATEAVRLLADHIFSNGKNESPICTENPQINSSIVTWNPAFQHRLRKLVPQGIHTRAHGAMLLASTCPYMKMNTLGKNCTWPSGPFLPAVELPEDHAKAEAPLLRMLEQSQS